MDEKRAIDTVKRWERAIRNEDAEEANCCLTHEARAVMPFDGEDLQFWKQGLEDFDKQGFYGEWRARSAKVLEKGVERATVYAYPVLKADPGPIWLVEDDGEWRIFRLFAKPDDEHRK